MTNTKDHAFFRSLEFYCAIEIELTNWKGSFNYRNIMTVAQVFVVGILATLVLITAFGIYTAFGPPSKKLADPYEMHED